MYPLLRFSTSSLAIVLFEHHRCSQPTKCQKGADFLSHCGFMMLYMVSKHKLKGLNLAMILLSMCMCI